MKQVILKGKVLFLILVDIATLILIVFLCPKQDGYIWNIWFPEIELEVLGLI